MEVEDLLGVVGMLVRKESDDLEDLIAAFIKRDAIVSLCREYGFSLSNAYYLCYHTGCDPTNLQVIFKIDRKKARATMRIVRGWIMSGYVPEVRPTWESG